MGNFSPSNTNQFSCELDFLLLFACFLFLSLFLSTYIRIFALETPMKIIIIIIIMQGTITGAQRTKWNDDILFDNLHSEFGMSKHKKRHWNFDCFAYCICAHSYGIQSSFQRIGKSKNRNKSHFYTTRIHTHTHISIRNRKYFVQSSVVVSFTLWLGHRFLAKLHAHRNLWHRNQCGSCHVFAALYS